jgi:hypothetical protein
MIMEERTCLLTEKTFSCPNGSNWVISPEAYKKYYLPVKDLYTSFSHFLQDNESIKRKIKKDDDDFWNSLGL